MKDFSTPSPSFKETLKTTASSLAFVAGLTLLAPTALAQNNPQDNQPVNSPAIPSKISEDSRPTTQDYGVIPDRETAMDLLEAHTEKMTDQIFATNNIDQLRQAAQESDRLNGLEKIAVSLAPDGALENKARARIEEKLEEKQDYLIHQAWKKSEIGTFIKTENLENLLKSVIKTIAADMGLNVPKDAHKISDTYKERYQLAPKSTDLPEPKEQTENSPNWQNRIKSEESQAITR